ncbi:SH3 domain-containing protein [Micromonospora echinospora]|uniref:SH3 domain-containing protein n=1 Tax=Micromonospora echinospora TaxID=1877 RepID=A0ABR6MBS2_MICEC|nr:hypothetical protein [Micromonospora echinospora]MBB5112832.1 hypothetical protein [Micromonospora echinospora]
MRKISSIGAAVVLTVATAGAVVTATAGPASAGCSHSHSNVDSKFGQLFNATNVNIRTGPHTTCASLGYGQLNHNVDFHCFGSGDRVTANGKTTYTWTYVRNVTTGVSGWVADALLDNLGGNVAC